MDLSHFLTDFEIRTHLGDLYALPVLNMLKVAQNVLSLAGHADALKNNTPCVVFTHICFESAACDTLHLLYALAGARLISAIPKFERNE